MQSDVAAADETLPASSNPSCFFLSLSAIPSSAPCEALSRSDTARIEVAANWAICEIRTAGTGIGKLPRECEDWQGGGKTVVADLTSLASTLTTLTTGLSANHARHSGSLALLESSLATAISNLEGHVSLHLRTEIEGLLGTLALRGNEMSNELQLVLGASVQEHEKELALVTNEVRDVLALALSELQTSVRGAVDEVERLDSGIQRSRVAVETSSSVLEEMATTLSDYHSTQDAMLKLHQTHIHEMEEIFANISHAAKDGFSIPELSFGTIMYIASRGIMRRSAHGAILVVSMLARPFWWPMVVLGAMLLGFAAVALCRRLWQSTRRISGSYRLPVHDLDSLRAPQLLAPDPNANVSRRRRPSRIPARLYNGGSW
ncbi:hypothetical protein RQP46_004517 [Phenoliferia psychrophenolica]